MCHYVYVMHTCHYVYVVSSGHMPLGICGALGIRAILYIRFIMYVPLYILGSLCICAVVLYVYVHYAYEMHHVYVRCIVTMHVYECTCKDNLLKRG